MDGQAWVESKDGVITVRVQGVLDEALVRECQQRVLSLVRATGNIRILYDTRDLVGSLTVHRRPSNELSGISLRRAIVVQPDARLSYLVRLAFGDGYYRIFHGDVEAACKWLEHPFASAKIENAVTTPGKLWTPELAANTPLPQEIQPTPPRLLRS